MTRKAFTVKVLVWLSITVVVIGVVFCLVYKMRQPANNDVEAARQTQNKANEGGKNVSAVQEPDPEPYNETAQNHYRYIPNWFLGWFVKWFEPITILTLALVIGVGITNYIYYKQLIKMREAVTLTGKQANTAQGQLTIMQDQLIAMEKQAKSADQSVVLGLRAYVGIHSVDPIYSDTKQICIRIENSGKVPASHIDVKIDMEVRIPEGLIPEGQIWSLPWKVGGGFAHNTWGYSHYYGRAKLFPGNLQIVIPVMLASWLSSEQISLIAKGPAEIWLKGNIEFSDGFNKGKISPFAFHYSHKEHQWIIDAVITKEEVEALLAERTKEYFGDKDPLAGVKIITSYQPPLKPAKAEDKEGKNKGNPN